MARCPKCGKSKPKKEDILSHIEESHKLDIPAEWSAAKYYYSLHHNGRPYGLCRSCGRETPWNEKAGKPSQLCGRLECKTKMREIALGNMMRVYNKPHLLNEPNMQKKMLANRKISGVYTWSDGIHKFTYTGSYEKAAIQFIDEVLDLDPKHIQMPGPTIPYDFKGELKFWLPDIYLEDFNLIIEIKDGGSDKNTHPGFAHNRELEKTKDELMFKQSEFNYVKITDKNMMSLIKILSDIRLKQLDEPNRLSKPEPIILINETVQRLLNEITDDSYISSAAEEFCSQELLEYAFCGQWDTPEELLSWMIDNISIKEFDTLMTSVEVYQNCHGSSHDQVAFEQVVFQESIKLKYGTLLSIMKNDNNSDIETHSLLWYEENGKIYWFENAWKAQRGIHGPYNNIDELKNDLIQLYGDDLIFGNYPNITISPIHECVSGQTIDQFIKSSLNESLGEPNGIENSDMMFGDSQFSSVTDKYNTGFRVGTENTGAMFSDNTDFTVDQFNSNLNGDEMTNNTLVETDETAKNEQSINQETNNINVTPMKEGVKTMQDAYSYQGYDIDYEMDHVVVTKDGKQIFTDDNVEEAKK